MERIRGELAWIAVVAVALGVYLVTISPTVAFWDAGEFIATSYILGIPHPPGTPLYVLIGRIFTLIPFASTIAIRVNILSAVFSALAVGLIYRSVVLLARRWLGFGDAWWVHLGAGCGALVLAFSDAFWNSAVEAEVYGLSAFFMALVLYLGLLWAKDPSHGSRPLYLLLYLLALSVGNHLAGFLVAFGLLALVWFVDRKAAASLALTPMILLPLWAMISSLGIDSAGTATLAVFLVLVVVVALKRPPSWRFVVLTWVLFSLALSVHLYLPIRSALEPAIDEADPETWSALMDVLQRKQYAPLPIFQRKSPFGYQILMFLDYFGAQMPLLAIAVGLIGAAVHVHRDKKTLLALGLAFLASSLGLIIYLNFRLPPYKFLLDQYPPDSPAGMAAREVRERDYFYTPAYFFFAYWIGIGAIMVLASAPRFLAARAGSFSGAITRVIAAALVIAMPVSAYATNYSRAHRQGDWIAYDYGANILASCDENAILFTNGDNDTFPLWFLQEVEGLRRDVAVVNLSLLNTPWYWLQLKHGRHALPISMSDAEIERLTYGVILPDKRVFRAGGLTLELKAGQTLRVQDLGVLNLIKDNNWQRPVYFAVTVSSENKIGLEDYLQMEGLVYRVLQQRAARPMDVPKTVDLLTNTYAYRGVYDPKVLKPDNTIRLLSNYVAAFSMAGRELLTQGDTQTALDLFDRAARILPDNPGTRYYRGIALHTVGLEDSALNEFIRAAAKHPELIRLQARNYATEGRLDLTQTLLERYLALHPGDETLHQLLAAVVEARQPPVAGDTVPDSASR